MLDISLIWSIDLLFSIPFDQPVVRAAVRWQEGLTGLGLVSLIGGGLWWLLKKSVPELDPNIPIKEPLRKELVDPEVVAKRASGTAAPQDVDVMVFAPAMVSPREEVTIQVIFHTPEREAEALGRAQKLDPAGAHLASVPLTIQVQQNDNIKVTVESADLVISEPVQSTNWNGRLVFLYFTVQMPAEPRIVRAKLRVFVNGVPAGNLVFKISVRWNPPDALPAPANETARSFRKPFLSYASEDRVHVLKAAQLLDALKMQYLQDILKLSPGDRWERRLYAEIDSSDVFLLFWSHHAQRSEWVIREAEYALECAKRAPLDQPLEIVPVLLEGPPPPLPPPSLSGIHFNDPIRHIIFAEESVLDASKASDPGALDRLGRNVKFVFETKRGMVASMKDGTALAIVGDEFERFESFEDYRDAYQDRESALWTELLGSDKRKFYQKAAEALRQINGDA